MNEGSPSLRLPAPLRDPFPARPGPGSDGVRRESWLPAVQSSSVAVRSYCRLPSMESPVDDIHLLLARQPNEIHCISRNTDRQVWIVLRMVHRIKKGRAIQHVHVDVITGSAEERIQHTGKICYPVVSNPSQPL